MKINRDTTCKKKLILIHCCYLGKNTNLYRICLYEAQIKAFSPWDTLGTQIL
jgi:hypothetical protein